VAQKVVSSTFTDMVVTIVITILIASSVVAATTGGALGLRGGLY
jgi:hypothetical protein